MYKVKIKLVNKEDDKEIINTLVEGDYIVGARKYFKDVIIGYCKNNNMFGTYMLHIQEFDDNKVINTCEEQISVYTPIAKVSNKALSNDELLYLWNEFKTVPCNPKTEEIEQDWHDFKCGTDKYDIWNWFDIRYDGGLEKLMLI